MVATRYQRKNPDVPYNVIAMVCYRMLFLNLRQQLLKEAPIEPDANWSAKEMEVIFDDCLHQVGELLIHVEQLTTYGVARSRFRELRKAHRFDRPHQFNSWIIYIANAILPTSLITSHSVSVVAAAILCTTFMKFNVMTPILYEVSLVNLFGQCQFIHSLTHSILF